MLAIENAVYAGHRPLPKRPLRLAHYAALALFAPEPSREVRRSRSRRPATPTKRVGAFRKICSTSVKPTTLAHCPAGGAQTHEYPLISIRYYSAAPTPERLGFFVAAAGGSAATTAPRSCCLSFKRQEPAVGRIQPPRCSPGRPASSNPNSAADRRIWRRRRASPGRRRRRVTGGECVICVPTTALIPPPRNSRPLERKLVRAAPVALSYDSPSSVSPSSGQLAEVRRGPK